MTNSLREKVCVRAANCCEYCRSQAHFSHDPFSAEHIQPTAKGGQDILENLAWSCMGCNFYKFTATFAIDLLTGELVPLFNPRKDDWNNHFQWTENFTIIKGRTPIGRATILRLKLNRLGLINLRQILTEAKKHPPEN